MARRRLRRKLRTYQSLASINQPFAAIPRHIRTLDMLGSCWLVRIPAEGDHHSGVIPITIPV